ncbi:retrovirus-related Pol polyprotein from transposon opus [Trichonephila clavata]|uniref:Retrovirus-related Pol polyprotein from transposon opus n=1 Tax=Trichonephila clavata TaxID=2740835 RepID=A0A8X6JR70_TRICU|nr:retrovirus-related Pol polyprotein from transposon opus [Trichonephila clavata]
MHEWSEWVSPSDLADRLDAYFLIRNTTSVKKTVNSKENSSKPYAPKRNSYDSRFDKTNQAGPTSSFNRGDKLKTDDRSDRPSVSCYGCGKPGVTKPRCPNCKPAVNKDSATFGNISLHSCSLTPNQSAVLKLAVNGIWGTACADSGASHSIAGEPLYLLLQKEGANFQKTQITMSLADGHKSEVEVYTTSVVIRLEERVIRTQLIILPYAKGNRTLLGMDFLQKAGIVLNLRHRNWFFSDSPHRTYDFVKEAIIQEVQSRPNLEENTCLLRDDEGKCLTLDQKNELGTLLKKKSRRERRALREKKLAGRKITSPPSYAARDSPTYTPMRHSTSKSRSRSPEPGKVMFITSFGGEGSEGEQLTKSGSKISCINSKLGKNLKVKDSLGNVIGPQLPSKNGDEEKYNKMSRNSSYSDSSRSSYRSKHKHDKSHRQYSRHRSKHSSRSSSDRSVTPRKSSSYDRKKSRRSSRSRSRSCSVSKSRSRSRSRHKSRHEKSRSPSRSRSKSTTKVNDKKSDSPQLPPPPVKSYYRHSLSRSNSEISEESEEEDEEEKSPVRNPQLPNVASNSRSQPLLGKAAPATKAKLTPQERLKRKMQLALKKQYKADKQAQMEKTEKQLQERQDRAEELREMAIKLRQRERERRHKMRGYDYDSDSDSAWSKNPDYNPHLSESIYSLKRNDPPSTRSNSSYSSQECSPPPATSSISRHRSRSKTPPRSSRRSPGGERRRSPYRRRSPIKHSPKRSPQRNYRKSPMHSSRNPSSTMRRYSPQRSSPRRHSPARNQSRRYSPSRSDSRRYSPSRNDSHRYSSRQYRQGNHSPSRRSRSPASKSYGTRPLVDY